MTDYSYPGRVSSSFPGVDEVYPPQEETDHKFSVLFKKFGLPVAASLIVGGVIGAGVMRHIDNNKAYAIRTQHALVDSIGDEMDGLRESFGYLKTHPGDQEAAEYFRIGQAEVLRNENKVISASQPGDEGELHTLRREIVINSYLFAEDNLNQGKVVDKLDQILAGRPSTKPAYLEANNN